MLIRMHTVSRQGMSLLSSVPVLYAYMNMHTSYTLTHTCGHRRTSTHTIIHTSKHLYQRTQAYVHTHAYTRTQVFMHTYSRVLLTHTCARAQNKKCIHRHYTQRTHTQIHSYANTRLWICVSTQKLVSTQNLYTYTLEHTFVHSHLCVRAHIHEQQESTCTITDRHTNMHACTQSLTLTHIYSRVRA